MSGTIGTPWSEPLELLERALLVRACSPRRVDISPVLAPEHFSIKAHSDAYRMAMANGQRNLVDLFSELAATHGPELAGAIAFCEGDAAGVMEAGYPAGKLEQLVLDAHRRRVEANVAQRLGAGHIDGAQAVGELQAATLNAAASLPTFSGLDIDSDTQPFNWLLEGWVGDRDIMLAVGAPGCGKSTSVAAMAVGIAYGAAPFRDGPRPTQQRPVIYFDAEMGERSTKRMFSRIRDGIGLPEMPPALKVVSAPGEISFITPRGRGLLTQTIRDWAERHADLGPPVVIVDTLSAAMGGVESMSDPAMVEPIYGELLFRWRDELGATVIIGHHPRKLQQGETRVPTLDMIRDSSTHAGKCSCALFFQRPGPNSDCLDVWTLKYRDRDMQPIRRLGYISSGNDFPIVLEHRDAPQPEDEAAIVSAQTAIHTYIAESVSRSTNEIDSWCETMQIPPRTARRALKALVDLGIARKPRRGTYICDPVEV